MKKDTKTQPMKKAEPVAKVQPVEPLQNRHLYLLRHAKASKKHKYFDVERPLAKRGRKDVKKLKRIIREMEIKPDLILCSPAARTRETLEGVMDEFDNTEVVFLDTLYNAQSDEMIHILHQLSPEKREVLVIGHNPALENLVALMKQDDLDKFPTATLACVEVPQDWHDFSPRDAKFIGAAHC